jgi:hypothetical protein
MRSERIIGFICAAIMMVSCGTKKQAVSSTPPVEEKPAVPAWHTCVMQGAKATILLGDQKISANTTLQVVRDTVHGFTAVIFQHECDHLDGILYTDRADSVFVR